MLGVSIGVDIHRFGLRADLGGVRTREALDTSGVSPVRIPALYTPGA
jgi:hypothetical protein